ncbi:MAG: hypothetical protein K2X47_17520 [Bdellovibrionales bacterium]|nr:hypothetical protein [Bdellovibrionales bacterium]
MLSGWVFLLSLILSLDGAFASVCSQLGLGNSLVPNVLPVVVLNTGRYVDPRVTPSVIVNTVYAPGTKINSDLAQVQNLNEVWFPNQRWTQFVVGDGSVRRAFNSVDAREGSRLMSWIKSILWNLEQTRPDFTDEDLIRFLAFELTDHHLGWTQHAYLGDGRAELPWDLKIESNSDLGFDFQTMIDKEVDLHWWTTRQMEFPVVPLERYLEFGKGYCLQRSIIASLILSVRGIRHRIVNGALDNGPGKTGGHTWLFLGDGRILDPSMNILERPKRNHPFQKSWYHVGVGYRFESALYPALLF